MGCLNEVVLPANLQRPALASSDCDSDPNAGLLPEAVSVSARPSADCAGSQPEPAVVRQRTAAVARISLHPVKGTIDMAPSVPRRLHAGMLLQLHAD
jgi:hypothetical protein